MRISPAIIGALLVGIPVAPAALSQEREPRPSLVAYRMAEACSNRAVSRFALTSAEAADAVVASAIQACIIYWHTTTDLILDETGYTRGGGFREKWAADTNEVFRANYTKVGKVLVFETRAQAAGK